MRAGIRGYIRLALPSPALLRQLLWKYGVEELVDPGTHAPDAYKYRLYSVC